MCNSYKTVIVSNYVVTFVSEENRQEYFGKKLSSMVIVGIVYVEAKDSQSTISFYRKSIFLSGQIKAASRRFLQIWKGTNIRILCSSSLMSSQFFHDLLLSRTTFHLYKARTIRLFCYECTMYIIQFLSKL